MAYMVMVYMVMAYSYGLYSYGLYSYGLYSYGLDRTLDGDSNFGRAPEVLRNIARTIVPADLVLVAIMTQKARIPVALHRRAGRAS